MTLLGMGKRSDKIQHKQTHQQSQAIQIAWLGNLDHSKSQSPYLESHQTKAYKFAPLIKQNNLLRLSSHRSLLLNFEKKPATHFIIAKTHLIKTPLSHIRIRLIYFFKRARNLYRAQLKLP